MRDNKLITVVGRKGCGKSHETIRILYKHVQGNIAKGIKPRRGLIFDVNDEFGDFDFQGTQHCKVPALAIKDVIRFTKSNIIEVRRIRPYFDNGKRMSLDDMSATLSELLNVYNCGTFVIEDPAKYLPNNTLNLEIISAMATCRHSETDLIIHFQSIGRAGFPQLFANTNYIRMHKTSDSAARHQSKFEEKLELLQLAENIITRYYSDFDNNRFYVYVDVEESRIRCGSTPFNEDDIKYSIQLYISQNRTRILKPLLDLLDMDTGRPIYNPQTALQEIYRRLRKTYFD